jgi:hypothetical protein
MEIGNETMHSRRGVERTGYRSAPDEDNVATALTDFSVSVITSDQNLPTLNLHP